MKNDTKYLTSIRGFACLIVVIAHILANVPAIGVNVSGCGKIGVWLFFVLSAFLLTWQWLGVEKVTRKNVFQFYCKRFFRIFPCYFVILLFAFLVGYITDFKTVIKHLFLLEGLGHFWTIPVEFVFYIFVPLFVFILQKLKNKKKSIIFLVMVGVISGILFPYQKYVENSIQLMWYLPVFMMGMMVAYVFQSFEKKEKKSVVCDILIGVILLGMLCATPYFRKVIFGIEPDRYLQNKYLYFGMAWSVVIVLLQNSRYIRSFLNRSKILYWFGRISFSLYLVHFIVLSKFIVTSNLFLQSIFVFIISVVLAAILNQFVEDPGIKIARKIVNKVSEN